MICIGMLKISTCGLCHRTIDATIEIIDVEMGKEPEYLTVGKTPLERVVKLLSKLHSIMVSQDRGSMVSKEAEVLLNKFIQQVVSIFNNLLKPLKLQSFLMNDLILLTDIPSIVQTVSVKHGLNKDLK
ncbi:MAG: hypothetical protein PF503_07200 [Desulfobacula sp.]|nr:hypothetical protein [Desulfobacula sp.]